MILVWILLAGKTNQDSNANIMYLKEFAPKEYYTEMDNTKLESHIISQFLIVAHVAKMTKVSTQNQILLQIDALIKTITAKTKNW